MDYSEKARSIKLNSIQINLHEEYTGRFPIGASKFGGRPDLPEDFKWYYFDGRSPLDNYTENRPLSFLLQINCEEIKKYDLDNRLPERGMLYFFYELHSMSWGNSPKDKGSARVYYYDGDISKLVRTDYPEDMPRKYKLPPIRISFESKANVPDYDEICDQFDVDDFGEYNKFMEREGYAVSGISSKLLGYADCIQGSMLHQCEMVSRGINFGGSIVEISEKQLKEIEEHKDEWKLLFQLDSISKGKYELMFGDCGKVYYYIREEDLKNKNFDNVWLVLECT